MSDTPALVPLLDADDVGRLLKLSPKTVYARARAGDIPSVRVGGAVRFRHADIARIVLGDDAPGAAAVGAPPAPRAASHPPATTPADVLPFDWSRRQPLPAAAPARPQRARR